MRASPLQGFLAVAEKDIRSELRTRIGITSLGLFVVTTVSVIVFAIAEEPLQRPLASALLWVTMFYTAMTGLGRSFITEEERGTSLYLRLHTAPLSVYFGKLAVNCILGLAANLVAVVLMMWFVDTIAESNIVALLCVITVSTIGLASVITMVSAIVAKAGTRNALLPVLAFPMLVPLLMPGVKATLYALADMSINEATGDLLLMVAYSGIVIVVSTFVFEVVWTE